MKKHFLILVLFLLIFSAATEVQAQCPMCRTAVESSMKNKDSNVGKGLNHGILYLLSAPYVAAGIIGFGWYRINRKKRLKK
ncbi:MAG: hypothetical protein H6605_07745 [Flavobacteriales bacterium]|nr:hypothetical protein [Flavobacteriales bacterium]